MSNPYPVGLHGAEAAASLSKVDWQCVELAMQLKEALAERPRQTGFRVFGLITYTAAQPTSSSSSSSSSSANNIHPYDVHLNLPGTQLSYVTGTNSECCFIGSSICCERSALLQLRMKRYVSLGSLYIITDSPTIVTPGLLCREMLLEFFHLDTPIVLASYNVDSVSSSHPFVVQLTNMRQLFPYPSLYLHVPGSSVRQHGENLATRTKNVVDKYAHNQALVKLYNDVKQATARDARTQLHPIQYAAGVLYSDGSHHVQAMTKLLEYGWSYDPIVKLIPHMEEMKRNHITSEFIIMCDQFGTLHSPFAPARAHLLEGGHAASLVFHNADGELVETKVGPIAPDVPGCIEDVIVNTAVLSKASAHQEQQ